MTDQINDDGELMRAFWEGMGVAQPDRIRRGQHSGHIAERTGSKAELKEGHMGHLVEVIKQAANVGSVPSDA
jgi:hypothetical protein